MGPVGEVRLRVPVGAGAQQWVTRGGGKRVLFVAHNVTSATRLLDVMPLFDDDVDVQCLATCTGSSPFLSGVPELLATAGLPVLPWEQAVEIEFDLVVSASYGGELHLLQGPLAVLSHGIGYNKRLAIPDTGYRIPDTGWPGGEGAALPPVFGLSAEWLLHDGRPIATATVLSHPEQLARLRRSCPEAARTAVLAGDPCFDRILESLPRRDAFRRRFQVGDGQRLVVLNSTWGPRSLFGSDPLPWLLDELVGGLPIDEYRVCAVLHPNIWHGHGPGQIQRWLRRAQDSGLLLIPPLGPWRQALVAADCVIGDHGSVTYYAAALGRPVLLGAFPPDDLDPASPVAELGRTAPRLRPYEPLRPQLEALVDEHRPARYDALAALTTSAPSKSAELLRQTFYELMGRAEPERPAILDRLETPQGCPVPATEPVHVLTRVRGRAGAAPEIEVTRQAGGSHTEAGSHRDAGPHADAGSHADAASHADAHTAVHEHTRDPTRLSLADLVLGYGPEHPAAWTAATLRAHPHAAMAAAVTDAGCCLARTADGVFFALAAPAEQERYPDPCDPAVYASALYAWLMSGRSADELFGRAATMTVVCGSARHQFTVEVSPRPPARECPERYP